MMRVHEIFIRDARVDDATALARIHIDARANSMPWLAVVHSEAETIDWMARIVIPQQRVLVAMLSGSAVGFTAFFDGWLEQLYVEPEHQNLGIGSRLFDHMCTAVSAPLQFWVFQRNVGARRFYERHGCRLLRATDGNDNEEREPDALYETPISER